MAAQVHRRFSYFWVVLVDSRLVAGSIAISRSVNAFGAPAIR
jgi:hypothetical protein